MQKQLSRMPAQSKLPPRRPGMQIAHAGRKASTRRPWEGHGEAPPSEGGWSDVVAPSPLPFAEGYPQPHPLHRDGIENVIRAFAQVAGRAGAGAISPRCASGL